jgi:hypothetical protein
LRHRAARKCTGAAAVAAVLCAAAPAGAQAPRYTWRASLTGTAIYDDNVFFEHEDPQEATAMRFRPSLGGGYRVTPGLSFDGSYAFDAEYYPGHRDLSDAFAGQAASLAGQLQAGERTSLGFGAGFSQSATAADLIPGAGLDLGRIQGRAWTLHGGGSRRLSKAGTLGLDYSFSHVSFGDRHESRAHSVSLHWSQQLSPHTGLSVALGPRFMDGSTSAEASASIVRRIERGSLSVGYGRSRYAAPGQDLDAESLSASAHFTLSPTVSVSASPSVYRHRYPDGDTGRSLRLALLASWEVRRGLSARAVYQHLRQDGLPRAGVVVPGTSWFARNLFAVSFSASLSRSRENKVDVGVPPAPPVFPQ